MVTFSFTIGVTVIVPGKVKTGDTVKTPTVIMLPAIVKRIIMAIPTLGSLLISGLVLLSLSAVPKENHHHIVTITIRVI